MIDPGDPKSVRLRRVMAPGYPQSIEYAMDELKEWLDGNYPCMSANFVFQSLTEGEGPSAKTVKRAKGKLGITSYQARTPSGAKVWFWSKLDRTQWRKWLAVVNDATQKWVADKAAAGRQPSGEEIDSLWAFYLEGVYAEDEAQPRLWDTVGRHRITTAHK